MILPNVVPTGKGSSPSRQSTRYRTPASRSACTASTRKTYVRSGKTMPGECRRRMGRALSSSRLENRTTTRIALSQEIRSTNVLRRPQTALPVAPPAEAEEDGPRGANCFFRDNEGPLRPCGAGRTSDENGPRTRTVRLGNLNDYSHHPFSSGDCLRRSSDRLYKRSFMRHLPTRLTVPPPRKPGNDIRRG